MLIRKASTALIERSGSGVAWLVLAMTLVTFAVVVLRYFFNVGWIWLQEVILYLHAAVFLVGAAWTLARDGHVRVDMLYRVWPRRRQVQIDRFGTLFLLLPFCVFTLWISADYVWRSWQLLEGSQEAGGLDGVFILKSLIPIFAVLLGLQALLGLFQPSPAQDSAASASSTADQSGI